MEGGNDRVETSSTGSEPLDHILAHDINNLLNIIQGNADLLLADEDDPEAVDRLTTIKHQTIAASSLLQTVGGITRGGARGEFDIMDVGNLLSIEVDRLRSAYPEATISMEVGDDVRVQADDLLLSVFTNLVENAIKHNDSPNPTASVTVEEEDGTAAVSVEDNGPGLPEEARDQLVGRSIGHPQSGVHIVRTLVENYGGDISVETGEGGTTVTVELPAE